MRVITDKTISELCRRIPEDKADAWAVTYKALGSLNSRRGVVGNDYATLYDIAAAAIKAAQAMEDDRHADRA